MKLSGKRYKLIPMEEEVEEEEEVKERGVIKAVGKLHDHRERFKNRTLRLKDINKGRGGMNIARGVKDGLPRGGDWIGEGLQRDLD